MKNNKKMFVLLFVSCITCLLTACGQVHYAHKVFGKLPEAGALNEISYEIIQGEYEKSEYSARGYHIYKVSDSEYYYTICSGERPSAGYAIEVSDIKVDEQNVWEVTVKETEPKNHYAVAESLTYPNCTLVLSGKPSGIVFRPTNGKWFGKLSEKGSLNGISYEIVPGEYYRSEYSARGIISEKDEEGDCYYTICQGEQRTGGYAVEIADIKANDQNEWEVIVTEIQPGRDSTVTTEVTYPYCILVLSSEPSGISFFNTDGEKFSNITSPDSSDPMETSDAASQGTQTEKNVETETNDPDTSGFYQMYIAQDDTFLDYMKTQEYQEILKEMDLMDFELKKIIVFGDTGNSYNIVDPEHLLGSFEGTYFLGYETEEDVRWAFVYYDFYCDGNVVTDEIVSTA